MSKFLIVGLGNIGEEYSFTRHNIGFEVADALAADLAKEETLSPGKLFRSDRLAHVCESKFKGKQLIILKPTTYMNLSGKAGWITGCRLKKNSLLKIFSLSPMILLFLSEHYDWRKRQRWRTQWSYRYYWNFEYQQFCPAAFRHWQQFSKGRQVEFVLQRWSEDEAKALVERIEKCVFRSSKASSASV